MNGKWIKATASAALALALFGVQAPAQTKAAGGDFELTVIHTNDTHAHLENGAKRATIIKQLKKENSNNVLLDAGDVFSGTLYFNQFHGLADLKLMNYLGYDAMTFGNHEFDRGSVEEDHKTLADFVSQTEFPIVSANTDFSAYGTFKDLIGGDVTEEFEGGKFYKGIIKEVGGEKVGIFGLTTEETPTISSSNDVKFSNYEKAANEVVAKFEEKGVNKIIAITHMGFESNPEFGNDKLLAEKVQGIDIIVGGHSHTALKEPVKVDNHGKPTVIVQTGQYADNIGELNVTFDENGVITQVDGGLHPTKEAEDDAEAAELLKEYDEAIAETMNESTGVNATVPLDGSRGLWGVRAGETNLGNLITDGMLETAKAINPDVTIAMTNGGGIRAGINEGPITVGEVMTVMPFGNTLGIAKLSGAEITAALEHSVRMFPKENGGFLHVSGMKYSFDGKAEPGKRVRDVQVHTKDGYKAIDPKADYYVATNTFTAAGGDGYDMFAKAYEEGRVSEPGNVDWEMFIDYIQQFDKVSPEKENRIVASMPFTDVDPNNEFTPFIRDLYYRDIIQGNTATTYGTNKVLSRTQATSILVRALGLETEGKTSDFKDLGNMRPETKAEVAAAQEYGIIKGSNGNFMPNEPVKRAQLALMLKRVYELQNGKTYEGDLSKVPFEDIGGSDEETLDAIAFLYENGIVDGSHNGTKFRPLESTSRAQAAKIFSNGRGLIVKED
ncbi:5'-nucleotidase C-terminal domain-containing protein [Bhargavaea ullalensis]|uniref:2',3'-cyclic-nucleotide 2'-phosphodiesterase (5'-nucleotidase family) n=1 Tax=Bhargavaea ullalensis TaxID=1265685 RepID=A0ABV2GAU4_9BACL